MLIRSPKTRCLGTCPVRPNYINISSALDRTIAVENNGRNTLSKRCRPVQMHACRMKREKRTAVFLSSFTVFLFCHRRGTANARGAISLVCPVGAGFKFKFLFVPPRPILPQTVLPRRPVLVRTAERIIHKLGMLAYGRRTSILLENTWAHDRYRVKLRVAYDDDNNNNWCLCVHKKLLSCF